MANPPSRVRSPDPVIDWLLDPVEPSVRYRTLVGLLGRPPTDPEVRRTRSEIRQRGFAHRILAERTEAGDWGGSQGFYRPKYLSTHWRMLVLSDLGLTREDPEIAELCERWMERAPLSGGGVGGNSKGEGHHCVVGNMARALIHFGYADDPRVRRSLEWLVESADPKGGWSCFGRGRNLDSWEGLAALAAYPRERWSTSMRECVDRACEFFLERELHRQGARYEPWYRFHDPVHYYYDVLVGLDLMTSLGRAGDPRLGFAMRLLRSKRRRDGRWNLDAVHPDVEGPLARWYEGHPGQVPTPFALESARAPSRRVTLRALQVLARVEAARSVSR